jgi:PAS domain S-box-containing protein
MAGEEGTGRYLSGWHRRRRGEIEKLIAFTPVHIDNLIWSVAVCAPVDEVENIVQIARRLNLFELVFVIIVMIVGGFFLFVNTNRWTYHLEREVERQTKVLRQTSNYLNNLIKYANAPIVVWDQDMKITFFNKAFEKMSGLSEAEIPGWSLSELFPEENRSDCLEKVESALKGEHGRTIEIPILRKDGEIRIGLWSFTNIYGDDGETVVATLAQGQDITEYKQLQEELHKKEKHFRKVIENIFEFVPEGLLVFTDKLNPFRKNRSFHDIVREYAARLNYTEQELAEIITEEVKNRIINEDYTEIRISKKQ